MADILGRAVNDGHRPATEESWFCPNCGKPAKAFVSFYRSIVCESCRWVFDVTLHKHFAYLGPDPIAGARAHAEQESPWRPK